MLLKLYEFYSTPTGMGAPLLLAPGGAPAFAGTNNQIARNPGYAPPAPRNKQTHHEHITARSLQQRYGAVAQIGDAESAFGQSVAREPW